MFKTYRIIPLVFILFLFGFTLITVSPVFAADSAAFVECTQLKHPRRNFRQLFNKKDCFRDLARELETGGADAKGTEKECPEDVYKSKYGHQDAVLHGLEAKIAELEAENARLLEQQGAPAEQIGDVARLIDKVAALLTQASSAQIEAFVACENINPAGYGRNNENYDKALDKQMNCFVDVASAL